MTGARRHAAPLAPRLVLLLAAPLTQAALLPDPTITIATDAAISASSNPLLLRGNNPGAVLAEGSISPSVVFTGATGDALDLGGILTGRQYSRRYGSFVLGGAHATATLRRSERLVAVAAASFRRDLTADTLTAGVDAIAAPQSIRNSWRGEGNVTWRPDSRTTIFPSFEYERSTFRQTQVLSGTRAMTAQIALGRRLNERTWIGLRPLATFAGATGQPDLDRLALFATIDFALAPLWRLRAEAGAERVGDAHDAGASVPIDRPAKTAFSGQASLCRDGEFLDACLSGSIGSEVSALDGLQRRKAVSFSATRRLSARTLVNGQLDYQRVAGTDRMLFRRSLDTQNALLRLERRLTADATLSAELRYSRRRTDSEGAPHAGYAGLRLRWEPRVR